MQQMEAHLDQAGVKGLPRAVAMAVAYYANRETCLAYPSNETLLAKWGFGERSVQRALRMGEELRYLHRQEQHESNGRRRVYLVGAPQLSLLEPAESGDKSLDARQTPACLTRVGSDVEVEPENTSSNRSPLPQFQEGEEPSPLAVGEIAGSTPRPALSERRSPSRRRRDRRRLARPVAPGPCPLGEIGHSEAALLTDRWLAISERLAQIAGEQTVAVWFPTAHLHSDRVLAVANPAARWVAERFRTAIEQAAGMELSVVACMGAPAGEEGQ